MLTEGKDFFGGVVAPLIAMGRSNRRGTGILRLFNHEGYWQDIADASRIKQAEDKRAEWEIASLPLEGARRGVELG